MVSLFSFLPSSSLNFSSRIKELSQWGRRSGRLEWLQWGWRRWKGSGESGSEGVYYRELRSNISRHHARETISWEVSEACLPCTWCMPQSFHSFHSKSHSSLPPHTFFKSSLSMLQVWMPFSLSLIKLLFTETYGKVIISELALPGKKNKVFIVLIWHLQMKRRPSNQQVPEDKVIQLLKLSFSRNTKCIAIPQREVRSTLYKESSSNLPLVCSLLYRVRIICLTFSSPPPASRHVWHSLSNNEDLHGIYGGDEFAM